MKRTNKVESKIDEDSDQESKRLWWELKRTDCGCFSGKCLCYVVVVKDKNLLDVFRLEKQKQQYLVCPVKLQNENKEKTLMIWTRAALF